MGDSLLITEGPTPNATRAMRESGGPKAGIERVYRYDLIDKSWTTLVLDDPIPLYRSCAVALDSRYVLVWANDFEQELYVVDTHTAKQRESALRIPDLICCSIVISRMEEQEKQLAIAGIFRTLWPTVFAYLNNPYTPSVLLALMAKYYADDTAYLMGYVDVEWEPDMDWKLHRVKVDDIFVFNE